MEVVAEYFGAGAATDNKTTTTKESKAALPADGGTVAPGGQDGWVTARAGHYAAKGRTVDEIADLLRVDIKHRCPLEGEDWTDNDLRKKAEGAVRKFGPDAEVPQDHALEDFYAYMPTHTYIYTPTREMWPQSSVNARVPPMPTGVDDNGKPKTMPAGVWLDRRRPVEQMTWYPGEPMLIKDRLADGGAWITRPGSRVFNLYRPRPSPAAMRRRRDRGSIRSGVSTLTRPSICSHSSRTACSIPARRPITRSCSADRRASARIRFSKGSLTRLASGICKRFRRARSWVGLTAS